VRQVVIKFFAGGDGWKEGLKLHKNSFGFWNKNTIGGFGAICFGFSITYLTVNHIFIHLSLHYLPVILFLSAIIIALGAVLVIEELVEVLDKGDG